MLLISLDACRADHLGSYGYSRDTSPFLDDIARQGLRFENAFVNTHGTPPSHATMLSSLYQETHRVQHNASRSMAHYRIPGTIPLLQERFRNAGYATFGVTAGGWMSAAFGYARGFDRFDDEATSIEHGARRVVDWVRHGAAEGRPVFVFLHTYEIHSPYDPPAEYRTLWGEFPSRFEASSENLLAINAGTLKADAADRRYITAMYDAGIRHTDDVLRWMFSELDAAGFFDDHVLLITSDHGEELGERGSYVHRDLLYDDLIHVPLILRGRDVPVGAVETGLASTIDVAPTLLARAGLATDPHMQGVDLLAESATDAGAVFVQYEGLRYAIRTRDWKLIINTNPLTAELYDLRADPAERRNVAGLHPETVRELERRLRGWRDGLRPWPEPVTGPDVEVTDEERERLRSLGYVQ